MPTVTVTEVASPQPLLAFLLLHHSADVATLSATLRRDTAQIHRSLHRLTRRGLVTVHAGQYEIVTNRRPLVADYAEGALSLRELAQATR